MKEIDKALTWMMWWIDWVIKKNFHSFSLSDREGENEESFRPPNSNIYIISGKRNRSYSEDGFLILRCYAVYMNVDKLRCLSPIH